VKEHVCASCAFAAIYEVAQQIFEEIRKWVP